MNDSPMFIRVLLSAMGVVLYTVHITSINLYCNYNNILTSSISLPNVLALPNGMTCSISHSIGDARSNSGQQSQC